MGWESILLISCFTFVGEQGGRDRRTLYLRVPWTVALISPLFLLIASFVTAPLCAYEAPRGIRLA